MIVWCTVFVVIIGHGLPFQAETAAKGVVKHETGTHYVVDFSEYAKKQNYSGDYSNYTVNKDNCLEDK